MYGLEEEEVRGTFSSTSHQAFEIVKKQIKSESEASSLNVRKSAIMQETINSNLNQTENVHSTKNDETVNNGNNKIKLNSRC